MTRILWAFVGACIVTIGVSAQTSQPQGQDATSPAAQAPPAQAPSTAPPTTPAPSASAASAGKKVTYSGCIERQPASAAAVTGAANMPFSLTNASPVDSSSPVATSGGAAGAAGAGKSTATAAAGKTYRLDGTDRMLSPHVGHKVEITGTLDEESASPAANASATGASAAAAAKLKVDSVKMVSTTCP
jgi:pyruvate/2-oxoglutarate dehydrogenase complex dihydrolipoamide acyltransferase (E2) component